MAHGWSSYFLLLDRKSRVNFHTGGPEASHFDEEGSIASKEPVVGTLPLFLYVGGDIERLQGWIIAKRTSVLRGGQPGSALPDQSSF